MTNRKVIVIAAIAVIVIAIVAAIAAVGISNDNREYTVTYNYNYGDTPITEDISYKHDTKIDAGDTPAPIRTDYVFVGWYFDKDCNDPVDYPYKVTCNVTFYAKYIQGDVTAYFNKAFLNSNYGKYLVNSEKETTGYVKYTPDGSDIRTQYETVGYTHIVFERTDDYIVFTEGEDSTGYDDKESFTIAKTGSYGTIDDISSVTRLVSNHEYLVIYTVDREYYIRDLQKDSELIGPSTTEPELINNSAIIFNNAMYCFDDDEYLYKVGDVNPDHMPTTGDGEETYGEFVHVITGDKTESTAYILYANEDSANGRYGIFDVKYTFKCPDNAHRAGLYYLENNNYLFQYSYETSSDDYSYKEDGVKYKLVTKVIDGLSGKTRTLNMTYVAFAESNMHLWSGFAAALSVDEDNKIANIISVKKIDSEKNLDTDGKILVYIGSDGTIKKVMSLSLGNYGFTFMNPTATSERYYVYYSDNSGDSKVVYRGIVDAKFNTILMNLQQIGCQKYFMLKAEGDNNIYDINGEVVGDSKGMTVAGWTNNVIFFLDDNGKLYKFDNGTMTQCSDYKSDLRCGDGYYGYMATDDKCAFYTENGTLITKTNSLDVREKVTLRGYHILEFWVNGTGSDIYGHTEFYRLTTGGASA